MQEIAEACGYATYNYLTHIFKQETGMIPRDTGGRNAFGVFRPQPLRSVRLSVRDGIRLAPVNSRGIGALKSGLTLIRDLEPLGGGINERRID